MRGCGLPASNQQTVRPRVLYITMPGLIMFEFKAIRLSSIRLGNGHGFMTLKVSSFNGIVYLKLRQIIIRGLLYYEGNDYGSRGWFKTDAAYNAGAQTDGAHGQ